MFTASVDTSDLDRAHREVTRRIGTAARNAVLAAGSLGVVEARRSGRFRDHSGNQGLRATIRLTDVVSTPVGTTATLEAQKPYASFVEAGTRPHEIHARDPHEQPLHFYWSRAGRWFRGPVVHHPGTQPMPFMGPAYLKIQAALPAALERELATLEHL